MIVDHLKRFAHKISIDVVSSLRSREMRRAYVSIERCFMQREERGVVTLDLAAAGFALAEVIAHRQQFRGGQATAGVVRKLFLGQVFH